MSFEQRKELYSKIEARRHRPVIAYYTSMRPNATGQMAADMIPELIKQLARVPKSSDSVDILIVSSGGDPMVAWRIISMLRERFKRVGALVPYAAYSAATLLVLGADEIVMHPYSNLGPVDPQLVFKKEGQGEIRFGTEDLRHYFDYAKADVGITDQQQLARVFELVGESIGPVQIGIAKRSMYLTEQLGEKLLSMHMEDVNTVRAIVEALNRSFYHHGYPVARKEAKEIGLPILESDEELEQLISDAWANIDQEFGGVRPLLPLGMLGPSEINAAYRNALSTNTVQTIIKEYSYEAASLESKDLQIVFRVKGFWAFHFLPNLQVHIEDFRQNAGWEVAWDHADT